ncbi:uncharacterized protein EI90DRAFT_32018 [Cantharellus anzutake]|uniref:uncharacterized protein n=1 Tax=Cantharellus anzutake TaxID=1750568 RepID=UPI0019040AAE|nr:uncharacterized protein EI90DRAFT_32018 [Cantharellus anzutake]KAF8343970.1 hypothetical protein EI90DRAFT_32018 [Cantharellus anzutake]
MSLFLSLWIAAIVEMVLYGLYISLFALFIWTVLHFRPSYYLLQFACGILAFLISTSFVILDICRIWNVMKVDGATGTRWYSDFFSSRISLVLSYLIIVNKTLASGVLIWRCYIIWNRSILICLPSFTFLTLSIVFSLYSNIKGYFLERAPNRWVIAVLSSFIITNITTISLILFKIWYETRYILRHSSSFRSQNPTGPTEMTTQQQHGHHHHQPPSPGKHFFGISSVIAIVLQTGIIYVIALIVHLIFCVISIVNNNNNGRKSGAGTTSSGGVFLLSWTTAS